MLALEFFSWWYGRGWRDARSRVGKRLSQISEAFSVGILLRTLFYPWRRIVTPPGRGLDGLFRAALDNAISRFIGFLVRLVALFAAACMLVIFSVTGVLQIVLWPLVPLSVVFLLIWGVV